MRQWLVDPRTLCDAHLLGEHVEHHMFAGTINRGKSIQGYLDGGLVDPPSLISRHNELAVEMVRRGMKHDSPLPRVVCDDRGHVDIAGNYVELARRCSACRERQEQT